MSLEQALADNTAAIKELTAAYKSGGGKAAKAAKDADPKTETKAETKPQLPPIDHKIVAEVVMDIANNFDRDSAVAILDKYGAKRCSELKEKDLRDVLKEATEKRVELIAAKAAAEKAAAADSLV